MKVHLAIGRIYNNKGRTICRPNGRGVASQYIHKGINNMNEVFRRVTCKNCLRVIKDW